MSNTQILSGPASKKRLVTKPGLAIDEASLARRVKSLSDTIRKIEHLPEHSDRVLFLRKELTYLKNQL